MDIPNNLLYLVRDAQKYIEAGFPQDEIFQALFADNPSASIDVIDWAIVTGRAQAGIAGKLANRTPAEALAEYNRLRQASGDAGSYEVSATIAYPTGTVDSRGDPILGHMQVRVSVNAGDTLADIGAKAVAAAKQSPSPKGVGGTITVSNPARYIY